MTRQHEDHRTLADRCGLTILEEITDNDISAAGKRRRPGFERLLAMVKEGQARSIIATDMSRLTRGKARDELRLLELGSETGLKLYFCRAPDMDLSTAAGRYAASIMIGGARHEIEQKSERQIRANVQAAQMGKRVGGRRPFGYEPDGKVVRELEAAALRRAYELFLSGTPLAAIAREWNAAGLFTPQLTRHRPATATTPERPAGRSLWTAQTLGVALGNPRYAGLRAVRRERPGGKGRKTWEIVAPATWPRIVDEETWRAASALLSDRAGATPARSGRALLTGVALCGVCGQESGATVHLGANNMSQPIDRCGQSQGHIARRAEPIDEYVSMLVVARLSRPDAATLLVDDTRPDVAGLRLQGQALRLRLDQLAVDFADGELTTSQLRTGTARIQEKLAQVEAELADAGRVNVLGPLVSAADVQLAWNALDTDRQRAVIDVLMGLRLLPVGRGTRTFRPESVEVIWKTAS